MTAVDLFCGYGGATAGMIQAGLEVAAAYDLDPQAVAAHRQWHPDVPCALRDIHEVTADELAGRFVWASPSCKPYSTANRTLTRGVRHPEYYPLAKLVEQARLATALVIENVGGLVWSAEGKEEIARLHRAAVKLGKAVSINVIAANELGIPQHRRRVIIVVGPMVLIPRGVPVSAEYAVMATEHTGQFRTDPSGHFVQSADGMQVPDRPGRSVERCAELQGIPVPAGFSKTTQYRLIGNAVPPVFAEFVCRQVLFGLRGSSPQNKQPVRQSGRCAGRAPY